MKIVIWVFGFPITRSDRCSVGNARVAWRRQYRVSWNLRLFEVTVKSSRHQFLMRLFSMTRRFGRFRISNEFIQDDFLHDYIVLFLLASIYLKTTYLNSVEDLMWVCGRRLVVVVNRVVRVVVMACWNEAAQTTLENDYSSILAPNAACWITANPTRCKICKSLIWSDLTKD